MSELPEELLRLVDVITPNEEEAKALTGLENAEAAARSLSEMGPSQVILTLGEEGVLYLTHGEPFYVPSFRVNPVDTTGCGDAFNGALACALAEGRGLEEAVRFAAAAGALAATVKGAQEAMPSRGEIVELDEEVRGKN